jgi:hypothetical protein
LRLLDLVYIQLRTSIDTMTVDAELLSRWRTLGARHSEEVLDLAPRVLKSGNLGEQGKVTSKDRASSMIDNVEWAVREQLAIAALDLGRISTATVHSFNLKMRS